MKSNKIYNLNHTNKSYQNDIPVIYISDDSDSITFLTLDTKNIIKFPKRYVYELSITGDLSEKDFASIRELIFKLENRLVLQSINNQHLKTIEKNEKEISALINLDYTPKVNPKTTFDFSQRSLSIQETKTLSILQETKIISLQNDGMIKVLSVPEHLLPANEDEFQKALTLTVEVQPLTIADFGGFVHSIVANYSRMQNSKSSNNFEENLKKDLFESINIMGDFLNGNIKQDISASLDTLFEFFTIKPNLRKNL